MDARNLRLGVGVTRAYLIALELSFASSITIIMMSDMGRAQSLLETTLACIFAGTGLLLLVSSLVLRKKHPKCALVAWLLLFGVVLLCMFGPTGFSLTCRISPDVTVLRNRSRGTG